MSKFAGLLTWLIEKLVLPLAIAYLAYSGAQAANNLADANYRLAVESANDRKDEFRRTMQSKYVELFYKDIASDDPKTQRLALGVLEAIEPSTAAEIGRAVASVSSISQAVREKVVAAAPAVRGPWSNYTIGIYFDFTDRNAASKASLIEERLRRSSLFGRVRAYPLNSEQLAALVLPTGLEVRYDGAEELEVAKAVAKQLNAMDKANKPNFVEASPSTLNFVSVFVPAE